MEGPCCVSDAEFWVAAERIAPRRARGGGRSAQTRECRCIPACACNLHAPHFRDHVSNLFPRQPTPYATNNKMHALYPVLAHMCSCTRSVWTVHMGRQSSVHGNGLCIVWRPPHGNENGIRRPPNRPGVSIELWTMGVFNVDMVRFAIL